MSEREKERKCVCVAERDRERECVHACVYEMKCACDSMSICVRFTLIFAYSVFIFIYFN